MKNLKHSLLLLALLAGATACSSNSSSMDPMGAAADAATAVKDGAVKVAKGTVDTVKNVAGTDKPGLKPEQLQKALVEAGKPAEQHAILANLAGSWKATSMWRATPEQKFVKSVANSKRNVILNGLFIKEDYDAPSKQQPFKGLGIWGYDKVSKKFTSAWVDTMSSSIWNSEGELDKSGKKIAFSGSGSDPITGAPKKVRSELEIVNKNKSIFRMYDTAVNGKEFKNLEIVYDRIKS